MDKLLSKLSHKLFKLRKKIKTREWESRNRHRPVRQWFYGKLQRGIKRFMNGLYAHTSSHNQAVMRCVRDEENPFLTSM